MGRRLPLLAVLILTAHAQERRVADRYAVVNLNSLPYTVLPPDSTNSTPRPSRTSEPRLKRAGGSPNLLPGHATAAGPAAFTGFAGLLDNYGSTPPDTGGAVGPHDVFTMLNTQLAVQSRSGAMRPHFPMDLAQFWSGLGQFQKIFDPRILYDAPADRWIAAAAADPGSSTAAVLLAVSQSGDPAGNWTQVLIAVGKSGTWADYPVLGQNKTWITVSANLLGLPPRGAYARTELYVFNKADLYEKGKTGYAVFSDTHGQFTPAIDFDRLSDTMYFAQETADAAGGRFRVSVLRGPAGSESFTPGTSTIDAGVAWGETSNTDSDFAPQLGSYFKVDTGDSRLQNCVLRNGSIWCAQTIFLPAAKPTRAAVQWFQLDPAAARLVQIGRVDDATATRFYAYPTIAVNKSNDVVVGYSRFTATDYPSAAFSFRLAGDAAHGLRAPEIFKAGEAAYVGRGADEGSNRWGDVSATVVDPVDDQAFWTIQEFAAVPTEHFLGRWGTWWANILMPCCSPVPSSVGGLRTTVAVP
jgi:hypothetical protein